MSPRRNPGPLFLALFVVLTLTSSSQGLEPRSDQFLRAIQVTPGTPMDDRPIQTGFERTRADTVWYGGHDGNGYAVEDGIWDFEDGMGGPDWQGWYGVDETENDFVAGYRVTADDFDCPADAPIINMAEGNIGQLWFGAHGNVLDPDEQPREISGDGGCWVCDAGGDCSDPATRVGYGNNWCQRAQSPHLAYDESAMDDIVIDFLYFLDCEGFPYDFTRVQIIPFTPDEEDPLLIADIDDGTGGQIGSPASPAVFSDLLAEDVLPAGTTSIALRFEFVADGGWSDEDGGGMVCSTYGPFGADSVTLSIAGGDTTTYDFEEGDDGWAFTACPGNGNFVDLHHISEYEILDPCDCGLDGWIMAFHDEDLEHPGDEDGSGTGQANMAVGPVIDRAAHPWDEGWNNIFWRLDMYAWLPLNNGVLYRPGMFYYPWTCEETGASGWSYRAGQATWFYVGSDPVCFEDLNNFVADGIPGDADLYRAVFQILSCCACFGIGDDCTGETNETPLIDNIRVGLTRIPDAPVLTLDTWGFQDGFGQVGYLEPTDAGRSDDALVGAGVEPPYILADSLGVAGPVVSGNTPPWECHLWFRVARKGPGQDVIPAYAAWKARLAGDVEADFVSVKMDSSQLGINAFSNKYCSFAHPDDPFYLGDPEADERDDLNEILPDYVFTPGIKIEYFITGNFIGNPERFFLPDTTGQYFLEFEILPSMRESGEEVVWPCVLYWDAYNRGAQNFIESALEDILPDVPGDGPNHDRYDELGTASHFSGAAIYRYGPGANNGGTLYQLLAYRTMILNTGDFSEGAMRETDFIAVDDWLRASFCAVPVRRQAFIANGDDIAAVIESRYPSLLDTLGAGINCRPYREAGCPPGSPADSSYCVKVVESSGAVYPAGETYYGFGNGCPNEFQFSVLSATDGIGNRNWVDYDGGPDGKGVVSFAQVVKEGWVGPVMHRTVIDGYSYHHITTTFDDGGLNDCRGDEAGRVEAMSSEVLAALQWIYDGTIPVPCSDPCFGDASETPDNDRFDLRVNRLYQNEPNPFNPRTAIRFSVGTRGPVELSIYDVGGRLVRRVVSAPMSAGLHTAVWDGTDGKGHKVGSGIYWSQLRVGDYVSNKKMVLLK